MRIVFAGTPEVAVPSLERLCASEHEVASVVTRPDAPLGRKRVLTASPVAQWAERASLPVIKTAHCDDDVTQQIAALRPDLGVVVAFGAILRQPLLDKPRHGWINLHFSLLPQWRGAAPVQRAVMAGDTVTGCTIFRLVQALDAGDIYHQEPYLIPALATAGDVLDTLARDGAEQLVDVANAIAAGTAQTYPQQGEPSYAAKLTRDDGRIQWNHPADRVLAQIRGTTPEPGAFTTVDGANLKIVHAHRSEYDTVLTPGRVAQHTGEVQVGTATDALALDVVQPAGKNLMSAGDWFRGLRNTDVRAGS